MFWTCRATVCSLITSVEAISRLLLPLAIRRSTSSSRGVSPCVLGSSSVAARRPRRGPARAPSCSKVLRAASSSSCEGLVVAERAARPPDEHSGARGLVGRFELLPGLRPPAGGWQARCSHRRRRARQLPRLRGAARAACRCRTAAAISLELAAARRRASSSVADSEHDLDVRRQQARPTAGRRSFRRLRGGSPRPRRRRFPERAGAAPARAAAPGRAGSPCGTPPRPPRTRLGGDRSHPAGSTLCPRRPGSSTSRTGDWRGRPPPAHPATPLAAA